MTERTQFLQAIAEDPLDDVRRLVFADWLQEHGEELRAEFIRAQIARSQLGEEDPQWDELWLREREIWEQEGSLWEDDFRGFVLPRHLEDYERGFPHDTVSASKIASLVTRVPLTTFDCLDIRGFDNLLKTIPRQPILRLSAQETGASSPGKLGERLAREPRLAGLRELTFYWPGDANLFALAESPYLAQLERLTLDEAQDSLTPEGYQPVTPEGIAAILNSNRFPKLRAIKWSNPSLENEGFSEIVRQPGLAKLEHFELGGCDVDPDGAAALAQSPYARNLTSLEFSDNPIGDDGLRALAESPYLNRVTRFRMTGTEIEVPGMSALLASQWAKKLYDLDLSMNWIEPEAPVMFANWSIGKLRRLKLVGSGVDDQVAEALARSRGLRRLSYLYLNELSTGEITHKGITALAHSPHLTNLRELLLVGYSLGDKGAHALAQARWPLRILQINCSKIDDEGIKALANSSLLDNVFSLNVSYNEIDDEGVTALARSSHLGRLARLNLIGNQFGEAGGVALVESTKLRSLSRLVLNDNPAANTIAQALARSPLRKQLTALSLHASAEPTRELLDSMRKHRLRQFAIRDKTRAELNLKRRSGKVSVMHIVV